MKKLIVTLAALACATSLAFAEPRGERGEHRGGVERGHMDRGEHRGTNEFRGGERRGGFHRGFHGGLDRNLYIGDPCWNWVPIIGWVYACD
jgi:hypothetical protein